MPQCFWHQQVKIINSQTYISTRAYDVFSVGEINTVELLYNVTSWDRRKSVVRGELFLYPNCNESFLKRLFSSMPKPAIAAIPHTLQTVKRMWRCVSIAADGAIRDVILKSNLSGLRDWPLNLTLFLFGHKIFVWWFYRAELTLQTAQKTCSFCYKPTKYPAGPTIGIAGLLV